MHQNVVTASQILYSRLCKFEFGDLMAKVSNPKLFSSHFGVSRNDIIGEGLVDPFLNVDLQLFIDPVLLSGSVNPKIVYQLKPCGKLRTS